MESSRIIERINEFLNVKMIHPVNYMDQIRKVNQNISLSFFRQNYLSFPIKDSIDYNLLKIAINKINPNLFYEEPKKQLIYLVEFLKKYQFSDSKLLYVLFQIKEIIEKEDKNIGEFIFQINLIQILYNYLLNVLPTQVIIMVFKLVSKVISIDYTFLQSTRETGFLNIYIKILEKGKNVLICSKVIEGIIELINQTNYYKNLVLENNLIKLSAQALKASDDNFVLQIFEKLLRELSNDGSTLFPNAYVEETLILLLKEFVENKDKLMALDLFTLILHYTNIEFYDKIIFMLDFVNLKLMLKSEIPRIKKSAVELTFVLCKSEILISKELIKLVEEITLNLNSQDIIIVKRTIFCLIRIILLTNLHFGIITTERIKLLLNYYLKNEGDKTLQDGILILFCTLLYSSNSVEYINLFISENFIEFLIENIIIKEENMGNSEKLYFSILSIQILMLKIKYSDITLFNEFKKSHESKCLEENLVKIINYSNNERISSAAKTLLKALSCN